MIRDTLLFTAALLVAALPLQAQMPERAPQSAAPQSSMTAAIEKLEHALVTATPGATLPCFLASKLPTP